MWSPASINLRDLAIGINMLGIVACDASSIIATSNFTLDIESSAADEFVVRITSLVSTISRMILFSTLFISSCNSSISWLHSIHFAINFIFSGLTPRLLFPFEALFNIS